MKAITWNAPGDVRHETVADPAILEPTDAILRVRVSAVCGSDLHVYHGRETGLDPGTVMGHEFVGEIVETGPGARKFAAGTRIVSPFTTNCGACFFCTRGLTARCERGQLLGWVEQGRGLHGAQAEYVRVPLADTTLVPIPENVPDEEGLLAGDVLATGWYCAEMGDARPGDTVAVIGCGPVGLMATLAAVRRSPARVFAVDRVAERLELARGFGAEPLASGDAALAAIRDATDGRGADVVLEAVGSPDATRLAVDLVRPGGTVAAVGVHTEAAFAFTPGEAYDKNLTYRAGRCPARRLCKPMLELLASGTVDVKSVISHRYPLSKGADAYRLFAARGEGCTKAILVP